MLRKLLKYEFKATSRSFGLAYLILLVSAVALGIILKIRIVNDVNFPESMFFPYDAVMTALITVFVFMIAAVFIMSIIISTRRFYRNLLENEGYMMNTLPVHAWQHVASKLVVSVVWYMASGIVMFGSILLMAALAVCGTESFNWHEIQLVLAALSESLPELYQTLFPAMLQALIYILLNTIQFILTIYAAEMLGHQAAKHKALLSVVAFIGLSIVQDMISDLVTNLVSHLTSQTVIAEHSISEFSNFTITNVGTDWLSICMALLLCVLLFVLTSWLLKNRLNLE